VCPYGHDLIVTIPSSDAARSNRSFVRIIRGSDSKSSNMVAAPTKPLDNKPKKAKTMRILSKREPQLVENTKNTLIFKGYPIIAHTIDANDASKGIYIYIGHATSQSVIDILRDISLLKKPNCKHLMRKNDILPFEDASSLEFLASKNDCSLFVMGSHTKKRPNNVTMVSQPNYWL
jgi:ribosome production factor 2